MLGFQVNMILIPPWYLNTIIIYGPCDFAKMSGMLVFYHFIYYKILLF